jgi:CubicO group peptidase (beta-lactamase class C family)
MSFIIRLLVKANLLLFVITVFLSGGAVMSTAQVLADSSATPSTQITRTDITVKDLETFLDEVIPNQLASNDIPGASVAVVKDGRLLFAKGYGYANLENQIPVVANTTLFRTGSVAKLFTWTAVMQLVEQGKLDLDVAVNTYLETFQIPDTFPEVITLRHLLTHTAGFEDDLFGVLARKPNDLEPLGEFVAKHIPARVYPPGTVTAYSNYGVTLAGYIVEQVAGMPFAEYVDAQIFQPLGMTRTTVTQPLPADLANEVARGYTFTKTGFQPSAFEYYQIAPAGSASATVTDMARFMLAFLQGGELDGKRILGGSSVNTMLTRHFGNDERLSGFGLGFYEMPLGGYRMWGHKGETDFFRTLLALLPEKNLGIYVAYNAPGGGAAANTLVAGVLEHFFPKLVSTPTAAVSENLRHLRGLYVPTRAPQTTLQKLAQLFMPLYRPISVKSSEPGVLELSLPSNPNVSSRWLAVGSDIFQREDGKDTLVMKDGKLFLDSVAPKGYQHLNALQQLLFQPWFPLACLVILIVATVIARVTLPSRASALGYWLSLATSAVALIVLVGLVVFLLTGIGGLAYGNISPVIIAVLAVGLLLIPLTLGEATLALVPQWGGGVLSRSSSALTALAAAALVMWLYSWNLLGFR